jgi:hypothetical protein
MIDTTNFLLTAGSVTNTHAGLSGFEEAASSR